MTFVPFLPLVYNAALLLALVLVYDALGFGPQAGRPTLQQVVSGLLLGGLGVTVMLSSWQFAPGVVFDTRSVLLSLAGLFFGTVPALVAVAITGAFRLWEGGGGALMGIAVIIVSAVIGLAWRHMRERRLERLSLGELYLFGVATHVAMVACMMLLPGPVRAATFAVLTVPVLAVYPVATALVGRVMVSWHERRSVHEAARELAATREHLAALVGTAPVAIVAIDLEGRVTEWNPAAERVFGWSREEVLGRLNPVVPESQWDDFMGRARDALAGETLQGAELERYRKDGSSVWVRVSNAVLTDAGGEPAGFLGVIEDVTERRLAKSQLEASRANLQMIYDTVSDVLFQLAVEGEDRFRFVSVNQAFLDATGMSEDQVVGKLTPEVIPEPSHQLALSRYSQAIREKRTVRWEETTQYPAGTKVGLVAVTPAFDEDGRCRHLVGVVHDITDRRRAEEALRHSHELLADSERRLKSIVDTEPACVKVLDTDGRLLEMNAAGLAMIEADSLDEVRGSPILPLVVPDQRRAFEDMMKGVLKGRPRRLEFEITGLKGGRRKLETDAVPLRDETGAVSGLLGLTRDVTERRRMEAALRESEVRYRSFFERDISGDYIASTDGRIIECNPALLEIFGFSSRDQALQTPMQELYEDPVAREQFLDQLRRDGEVRGREITYRRRDGRDAHVIENAFGIFDDAGELIRIQGFLFDITERRELERAFLQAQKMEGIGRLAGGVAHDFNNILQAIFSHVSLAVSDSALGRDVGGRLADIQQAAERASSLTRQLLAFSRRQVLSTQAVDLNDLVAAMLKMLRRLVREDVQLELAPGMGPLVVEVDPGQIEQVLLNLVVNAGDATGPGGRITIRTWRQEPDNEFRERRSWATEGTLAAFEVADDGCGMPADVRERIFEPFFTTKESGRGTGLGLSTVYGIIAQHGGAVEVASEPGEGARFTLFLPLVPDVVATGGTDAEEEAVGGEETILFAEDDSGVRSATVQMLTAAGYTVLAAEDGAQALRLFEEHVDDVDLALLDVVMPGLGGRDLEARLRRKRPDLPVLFTSGYTDDSVREGFVLDTDVELITKPHTAGQLLRRLRDLLERRKNR